MAIGLLDHIDDKLTSQGIAAIDPLSFKEQLFNMPKFAIVSSGDEFMQFDWTNIWSDELDLLGSYGEQHLSITPNAEHTLITGIRGVLSNAVTFARSVGNG